MRSLENDQCPLCFSGSLHLDEKEEVYSYKNHHIKYLQPGYWCDKCDDGIIQGVQIMACESLIRNFRLRVDNQDWED